LRSNLTATPPAPTIDAAPRTQTLTRTNLRPQPDHSRTTSRPRRWYETIWNMTTTHEPDHTALAAGLNHVAGSAAALAEVRQRLVECEASDGAVRDYGAMLCVSFTDPDGMGSEICWIRDPSLRDLHAPTSLEGDLTDLCPD